MKNKKMLMSVVGAGLIALTSCQSSEKVSKVQENPNTQLSEENINEEKLRAKAIKKNDIWIL